VEDTAHLTGEEEKKAVQKDEALGIARLLVVLQEGISRKTCVTFPSRESCPLNTRECGHRLDQESKFWNNSLEVAIKHRPIEVLTKRAKTRKRIFEQVGGRNERVTTGKWSP